MRRTNEINEPLTIYVSYDTIGEQWHRRFLNRHHKLESVIPESIEAIRIKETSTAVLQEWFDVKLSWVRRQPVATGGNRRQPGPYWSHMGHREDAWATGKLHGTWRGCLEHDEASWTMSRWQGPGVRVRMESRGLGAVPREYRQFADIEFFLSLQHRPSRPKTGP